MLTPEQKAAYLADSGKCPICGSSAIVGDEIQADGSKHYQTIECNDCDASWVDVYTLSDIEMDEPGYAPGKPEDTPGDPAGFNRWGPEFR